MCVCVCVCVCVRCLAFSESCLVFITADFATGIKTVRS